MKSIICAFAGFALVCALTGCGGESSHESVCGDFVCDSGESASSCAEDCGCGNGILNAGEDCEGTDVGTATCESVAQRGGTLGCNADCTFDVTGCDEYMCGNGIVEPGEDCDGSDVAGATCESAGFSGGAIGCTANCQFDIATCCNNFCETANTSVCNGDTVETCTMQANGCLNLELTDCEIDDDVCDDSSGTATCQCIDRCPTAGIGHCDGAVAETCMMQADGCLAYTTNTDCATTSQACAVGPQGSTCVAAATGENCSDPYPLTQGQNVIGWSASVPDYLTTNPSCNTSSMTGPDVVLSYTAAGDGILTYSLSKQTNHRHVIVVSSSSCGSTLPHASCAGSDFYAEPTMGDAFAVTSGTTYYFYVRDTTSGSDPLPSPLVLDVEEAACSSLTNGASNLFPANGAVLATTSPVLSFDLAYPVRTNVGVITITGSLGTNRTFDLSTTPAPSQVTFTNGGRTIQIDPTASFLPSEVITVSWSGLVDELCGAPIPPPTWSFNILTPSCTPGVGGMVGTTLTRHAAGLNGFASEYYVAADSNPNGYVYVGGTGDLYRMPKAGGEFEDVSVEAGITTTPLGYSMALVGNRIFTLDTATTPTSPFLWRLSTSAGLTWYPVGYGKYPVSAGASAYAMFHYNGRIYLATNEGTTAEPTQIWSVPASSVSVPTEAVLEGTVNEEDCDGISGDDHYFYLVCDDANKKIIRIDRTTFQSELLTDKIPLNTTRNELQADDFNGDGTADALYVKGDDKTVQYICGPGAAGPFWHGQLVDFGGADQTTNYGLGFDPVANVLWTYDDDTQEIISIQ